jgi:hypothetical protein
MSDRELDAKIQQKLGEWFRLKDEARPIKDRLNDPHDQNHYVSDEEVKMLLAPDKKFSEMYGLLRAKYPEFPPEE